MKKIVQKSIEELNEVLPKNKKLLIESSTPLVGENSKLESIDIVNLFVSLEKNLKKENNLKLTFDEIFQNLNNLKTIGTLENFLTNKYKNEK